MGQLNIVSGVSIILVFDYQYVMYVTFTSERSIY